MAKRHRKRPNNLLSVRVDVTTIMTAYQDTLNDIKSSLGIVPGFMKALPEEVLMHDWPLFKKYTLEQTSIPNKYRELAGLMVAANIKCPYCVLFHTAVAKMNGATQEELSEVYFLASYTSRWSAILHAQQYDFDTLANELQQIGAYLQSR
jgi:AhpD family alkylhydroperoxidase